MRFGVSAFVATLLLTGCSALTGYGDLRFVDDARPDDASRRRDATADASAPALDAFIVDASAPDAADAAPPDGRDGATAFDASDGAMAVDASADATAPPRDASGSSDVRVTETTCSGCTIDGVCVAAGATDPDERCNECDPGRARGSWSVRACDDAIDCTLDECVDGACRNPIRDDHCLIGGRCHLQGTTVTGTCEFCDPTSDPFDWTARRSGPCDDRVTCTSDDQCDASGLCRGTLDPGYCRISGTCHRAGTLPGGCRECRPEIDPTSSQPLANGAACTNGPTLGQCCGGACFAFDSRFNCGRCGVSCPSAATCCPVAGELLCAMEPACDG